MKAPMRLAATVAAATALALPAIHTLGPPRPAAPRIEASSMRPPFAVDDYPGERYLFAFAEAGRLSFLQSSLHDRCTNPFSLFHDCLLPDLTRALDSLSVDSLAAGGGLVPGSGVPRYLRAQSPPVWRAAAPPAELERRRP